jgi:hypothetical protein
MADPYSLGFSDPFNSMDPFDQLLGPVPRRQSMIPLTPQEEASLLSQLGGGAMSGLSYVGESLDKPGKALRGLLAGKPAELAHLIPFSDFLGITDSDGLLSPSGYFGGLGIHATDETQTVGGRDLLEQWGALAPNQEGLDWGDAAGFGAEVLLDPSLLVGGPLLKAAGKAPLVAKAADALRYNKVVNPLAATFDASLLGATSTVGQKAAPEVFNALEAARVGAGSKVYEYAQKLQDAGLTDESASDLLRQAIELPHLRPQMPPVIQDVAASLENDFADRLSLKEQWGLPTGPLDDVIGFGPRQISEGSRVGTAGKQAYPTNDPFNEEREAILKGLKGGTLDIKEMARDPVIGGMGRTAADNAAAQAHIEATYGSRFANRQFWPSHDWQEVPQNFALPPGMQIRMNMTTGINEVRVPPGAVIPPMPAGYQDEFQSQAKALAGWLGRLDPDVAAKGAFGQHTLDDAGRYFMQGDQSVEAAKGIVNLLSKHAKDPNAFPLNTPSKSVKDVFATAGIRAGQQGKGALEQLAQAMGTSWSNDLLNYRVPEGLANDLGQFLKAHTGPEPANMIVGAVDSFTNMFKAGVLTWPARYVRDLTSGMFNNWIGGVFKPTDYLDAGKIIRGGVVDDAASIPVVQQMLRQRGLPETPENATNVLRQLIAAHELSGRHTHAQTAVAGSAATAMDELLGRLPGTNGGWRFGRDVVKQAIPKSLNPKGLFDIRGVGGRVETGLGVVKAGENMGYATDSANRIAPFLNQLRKGVEPMDAAKKVMRLQVDYRPHTFTKTEQQVFKRLAPFYSFTRKTLPFVLSELAKKPGGKLAQTIRASNTLREESGADFVPPHIAQTLAIPIGSEQDGHQRFITGFGLPHEDALGLLQFGGSPLKTAENLGEELLGRLNPLVKAPAEVAAGKQFFTGRELSDLDGSIERLYENVTGDKINRMPLTEQIAANLPTSRLLTTARTLSDPRKSVGTKLQQLGTGIRTSDVDLDKHKSIAARESLEELLRGNEGVSVFEHLSIPEEAMALMTPEQQQQARLYKTLGSRAQKDARERKKERAASF